MFAANVLPGIQKYWKRPRLRAPEDENGRGRVRLAAAYWLEWNRLAGRQATHQFHLETLDERALLEALGVQDKVKWPLIHSFRSASMRRHQTLSDVYRAGTRFTWTELELVIGADLAAALRAQAQVYGYSG